jgi:hypothetical protein
VSKSAKQALLAELTVALASVLTPRPAPLPKSVAQAVDDLAESILRWRARQTRPTRPTGGSRPDASTSDELARLMDSRLHEELDAVAEEVEMQQDLGIGALGTTPPPAQLEQKPPRPRLVKRSSPNV